MSDEVVKAQRRALAQTKRIQAQQNQNLLNEANSQRRALEGKIERLQSVKKRVQKELQSLDNYSRSLSKLKKSGPSTFNGNRKDKYEKELSQCTNSLSELKIKHQHNEQKIQQKITQLQSELTSVDAQISSVSSLINSLMVEANQLTQ